jgi:branched-chain amino acid transport system substrate-binding protein
MKKLGKSLSAAILIIAMALTGCSNQTSSPTQTPSDSSKSSTSSGTPSTSAATNAESQKSVQGVTDTTIKMGTWGALTGPAAAYSTVITGIDAYLRFVNESEGGVHGRKLELAAHNDEYLPSKTVAAAKKLVEEDKVFAIVGGLGTPTNAAVMPYLTDIGIPVVAPATGSSMFASEIKKNYFALQTNYVVEGKIFAKYAKEELNAQKVGIFYQNDDFGKEGYGGAKEIIEKLGMELVESVTYNPTDVDYSTAALKMKEANPDVIMGFSTPKASASFMKELDKLGFTSAKRIVSHVNASSTLFDLAGSSWEGVITSSWLPILDEEDPQFKDYYATMKKHFPNADYHSSFGLAGWAYAEVAVEGLRRAGKDLTWDSYIKAMETFDNWNDGFAYNISYRPDMRQGQNALALVKAENGKYIKISDYIEYVE